MTVNAGKEVRLRCHVKGFPQPKIKWFKNEAPFEPERRGRITVRKDQSGSKWEPIFSEKAETYFKHIIHRIRIKNLDVADTGYYRCEATNGFEKAESTGVLKVLMGKFLSIVLYTRRKKTKE